MKAQHPAAHSTCKDLSKRQKSSTGMMSCISADSFPLVCLTMLTRPPRSLTAPHPSPPPTNNHFTPLPL